MTTLHSYWPKDCPEDLKTRILDCDVAEAANTLEDWWKTPIDWKTTTRTLGGWLVSRTAESTVTIENGGYSVVWVHVVYRAESA